MYNQKCAYALPVTDMSDVPQAGHGFLQVLSQISDVLHCSQSPALRILTWRDKPPDFKPLDYFLLTHTLKKCNTYYFLKAIERET